MKLTLLAGLTIMKCIALSSATVAAEPPARTRIPVDVTLYRKHQACLADVRGTAGKITAIHLVPSIGTQEALDELMIHLFWDGSHTPFIVCSVGEFLSLLGPDGTPRHMPELVFSNGFRIFVECIGDNGAHLQGNIDYETSVSSASSKRVRYDPGLGITTPQLFETVRIPRSDVRVGRGEGIEIPSGSFESGTLQPWRDVSWEPKNMRDRFNVYPTGTEGVRAHTGQYMAGIVRGGNCVGLIRTDGLVPGYRYRLSAWVNTYGRDNQGFVDKAKVRVGINTTGTFLMKLHPEEGDLWTTDFSHERFYFPHCWGARMFPHSHDHWSRISTTTRAKGEVACILLNGIQLLGDVRKWSLFDDITLENVPIPMGEISGRVADAQGKRLKRATVQTHPYGFAASTAGDGRFRIDDVPEGLYTVRASAGSRTAAIGGVRVLAGCSVMLEFALGDSPGANIVPRKLADNQNRLINGGFESGDSVGWQRAYLCDGMDVSEATKRVAPVSGSHMFGGEHVYHYANAREIIYQRVPVEKGSIWAFHGRLFGHSGDGGSQTGCRLVADPSGGTDFPIASELHCGEWKDLSLSFVAQAETIAVGVAMVQRPRPVAGLSDDRGIVDHLPDEEVRTDYDGYYCDALHLAPAGLDAELAQPARKSSRPTVAAGKAPALPEADTATILLPDGKTEMELIHIPAGSFLMGGDSRTGWANDDEFPRHHVELDAYWIGKYEVTNAQYRAFCDDCDYPYPPDPAFSKIPWMHRDKRYSYGDYFTGMPNYPVVNITWHDARAFCNWAGLRLPTEAEWEMAARGHGSSLRTYPWGEQTDPAWTTRTRDNTCVQVMPDMYLYTAPVGKFETHRRVYCIGKSIFGVSEMGGNVREWCADWYGPYSAADQVNPEGPSDGIHKVLRGGCWRGRDYGVMTRCSYRWRHDPAYYEWGTTGFRVAAEAR